MAYLAYCLAQRDNQLRTYFFIKNNEKPRKHCVCEVFFLPEKRAENCSKTDGSTHTAPTNILSVKPQKALSLIRLFGSLMRDFLVELKYSVMKAGDLSLLQAEGFSGTPRSRLRLPSGYPLCRR